MSTIKSKSMSETANHSVLPEPHQLSRGMYTREGIASMTPAHTIIESKVKAPSNSIAGMGLISNPFAPRRSTRLAKPKPNPTTLNLDSPTCPPSFRAAKTHRMTTRSSGSKIVKSSRVSKTSKPVKRALPTATVSKAAVQKYREIMKAYPAPVSIPKPKPTLNIVTSPTQTVITTEVVVSTQVATFTQNQPLKEISYNK
ncbi:hypothetical protein IFR05_004756 [Cadophora sp. M221]|nr:hypothetical protein IFR05_004756 [Cadophora sp. M221]